MNVENIIGDYQAFFSDMVARLAGLKIGIEGMSISHICYRVATQKEYAKIREQIKAFCRAYAENDFNGRPISMFLLKAPLVLLPTYSVSLIELPAPKPSHPYPTGLEHVGFIVGEKFSEFRERYRGVMTGQKDRGPYCQPLFITFVDGTTAKFYERSLEEVVRLEGLHFVSI